MMPAAVCYDYECTAASPPLLLLSLVLLLRSARALAQAAAGPRRPRRACGPSSRRPGTAPAAPAGSSRPADPPASSPSHSGSMPGIGKRCLAVKRKNRGDDRVKGRNVFFHSYQFSFDLF